MFWSLCSYTWWFSAYPVKETLFWKQNCSFYHLTILDSREKLEIWNLTSEKRQHKKIPTFLKKTSKFQYYFSFQKLKFLFSIFIQSNDTSISSVAKHSSCAVSFSGTQKLPVISIIPHRPSGTPGLLGALGCCSKICCCVSQLQSQWFYDFPLLKQFLAPFFLCRCLFRVCAL